MAAQENVRQERLVGGSDDPRGQLRPRIDGLEAVRLRRRARRRLGAGGGHLLGRRDGLARRQALYG